ncbi:hypothetical protein RQP53_03400 [Paucibacter sp. APW11]|uniref:PEP-CTERM protein-sorting domain-containing protein n=1 Tax=Roseateles aquae TaxID=3077235 RepID=A0ABU3P8A8_9BURK|nr:hypothetical protein [Paucibacter sp. APW11]MDT8998318.1 hypothetical protein [Paucibacter sp. APW11]
MNPINASSPAPLRTLPLLTALAMAGLLLLAQPARADLQFLNATQFSAALQHSGSDSFADLPADTVLPGPLLRQAGDFAYQLQASNAGFYGFADAAGGLTLSTEELLSGISFSHFAGGVNAFALDLSALNFYGQPRENTMLALSVTDLSGGTSTRQLSLAEGFSHLAFVSSAPLASVSFSVLDHGSVYTSYVSPGISHVQLAIASSVPEPASAAQLAFGLFGLFGLVALKSPSSRQRRRRQDAGGAPN